MQRPNSFRPILPFCLLCIAALFQCQPLQQTSRTTLDHSRASSTVTFPTYENNDAPIIAGHPPEVLTFYSAGDSYTVPFGTPIKLAYEGVDAENTVLIVTANPEERTYTFSLKEKSSPVTIVLSKKCQVTEVFNTDTLPRIQVTPTMRTEQVIITPILDAQDCTLKGFQIRLGTIERGCFTGNTREYLRRLQRCRARQEQPLLQPRKTRRSKSTDCLAKKLFGIECP